MGCKKCNGIIIPEALRGIPGPQGPQGPAGAASTVPGPTGSIGTTRLLMFSGWSKWNLGIEEVKKSKTKSKFGTKKSVKPKKSIKF